MHSAFTNALSHAPAVRAIGYLFGALASVIALTVASLRLLAAIRDFRVANAALKLQQSIDATSGVASFTQAEIANALKNYIQPDCAQTDPSNQNDLRFVVDVREPIFRSIDRFIASGGEHRFLLILADSGMGKTTFCLNYYARAKKVNKGPVMVIPLIRPGSVEIIKAAQFKQSTVLLLDAFDEDPLAIANAVPRLAELMAAASDFKSVIITCRSQFFANDASVPSETGVAVIRPRKGGEEGAYRFYKLYLLPFTDAQIDAYVSHQFPGWLPGDFSYRRQAHQLISEIPELSVRPMLLALVPDLIKARSKINELADLYKFMVGNWLQRESKWIPQSTLLRVSKALSVYILTRNNEQSGRVDSDELTTIAQDVSPETSDWKHLTARSLLNRDSAGLYKFAHRSIMEYLFVLSAIDGNERCFEVAWTDFMRDIFVSWGRTTDGLSQPERANEILSMDLRNTRLTPLSSPLPTPKPTTPEELVRRANTLGQNSGGRRTIPDAWRTRSLRRVKQGFVEYLFDFEYDLTWQIVPTESFSDPAEAQVFRVSQSELYRFGGKVNGFRLPSIEEFMSLLRAERSLDWEAIDHNEVYWLGDSLARDRSILLSKSKELSLPDIISLLPGCRIPFGINENVFAYEFGPAARQKAFASFSAMAVGVIGGRSEELFHRSLTANPFVNPNWLTEGSELDSQVLG